MIRSRCFRTGIFMPKFQFIEQFGKRPVGEGQ